MSSALFLFCSRSALIAFLRRLAEMNLVLDAAEYETLRRVAFGDGDPTLPAFKEAMRLDERTKPHAALHHRAPCCPAGC